MRMLAGGRYGAEWRTISGMHRSRTGPWLKVILGLALLAVVAYVGGFVGYDLLRADREDGETEFVTVTYFESLDAIRAFAGEDYEAAVVPPEARQLLTRFEERSCHYEVLAEEG